MIDISGKIETLRTAVAESRILASTETIEKAFRGETPKGDVLNVARAAAVLAAKKTAELIPYCHPLHLDFVGVTFNKGENEIRIRTEAKTIAKTGVEMEALTAATIAALTVYDMLKGIDKEVVIGETKLVEKRGGKSDYGETFLKPLTAAVLVTSDSVSDGKKSDKSGKMIVEEMGRFPVKVLHYEIVPDDREKIRQKLLGWSEEGIQLVLTTGGTGLGPRDVTVEAVSEIIEREVPGIAEAMRGFGQRRTPYAMLSRGVVGVRGGTLFITLPGSSKGVVESIQAIFPNVLHLYNMMRGGGH
ncbi:MAG: bifunctional molybdenum cofactor biosynthesis protein MoaC/MoaB [Deltaproteobacteria bacterium]|nr:bifunctional molybdenum cofactor biosynthesis protein MoaC/MoaB [Deltaproteobacteria bacterium]MBI4196437.1 bifunctional molybdenum cofactor biosynthesis protein MoaC/MoaB [Deltaproteobacteria bacterium]